MSNRDSASHTPGNNVGSAGAVRGALAMLAGIASLAAMDACAKWLVMDNMHPFQMLAVRSVLIVLLMLGVYVIRGRLNDLKPTRTREQSIRGLLGFLAPLTFFLALKYLPMTDAIVVFFTSTFMVTMLSALVLGEHVGIHRWIAVCVGYLGVLVAMTPSGEGSWLGYALVLISSFSYASLFISGRWLSKTETVSSLVFSYNLGVGIIACLALPYVWVPMSANDWAITALLATLAIIGHYALTYAFSQAEASLIAPFEYSAVIWAIIFDYFLWHKLPAVATLLGACIVIGSSLYVIHRESLTGNH